MDPGPRHHGTHLIYQASEDTYVNAAEVVPHPELAGVNILPNSERTKSSHDARKHAQREDAKRMRAGAAQMLGIKAAEDAAYHGLKLICEQPPGITIAGYMPIGDELDSRILLSELSRRGFNLALPVVTKMDTALAFRRWDLGDPLNKGAYGISEPVDDAPTCVPDIILVPLLAFDENCYRLGYGGGYYDRTLAQHPHIKAFGLAYAAQFVDNMVVSNHDWPLQGVITEEGIVMPRLQPPSVSGSKE